VQGAREGAGGNVLRLRVERGGDLLRSGRVRPVPGEDLVGAPAEQEPTRLGDELRHATPRSVPPVPAPVLEAAGRTNRSSGNDYAHATSRSSRHLIRRRSGTSGRESNDLSRPHELTRGSNAAGIKPASHVPFPPAPPS